MTHRDLLTGPFAELGGSRWRSFAKGAQAVFPADCFPAAEAALVRAAQAVAPDPDATRRVQFLRDGLTHAMLSVRVSSLLTLDDPASTPERGAAALKELLKFRRRHEREWIYNLNHAAWVENASWKLSNETKQPAVVYP